MGDQQEGEHGHAHGGVLEENTELIFATLSGVMLAVGWLIGLRWDGLRQRHSMSPRTCLAASSP